MGRRLVVYDRTCTTPAGGLAAAWRAGALLYRARGDVDAAFGVADWDEAAARLAGAFPGEPFDEVQYWGHGRFGRVLVDRQALDGAALSTARVVAVLRERLAPSGLVWLRTCEAFGGHAGHTFAIHLADALGVRVAGHTHVIGFWQSGLHTLAPGQRPAWDAGEGVLRGNATAPELGAPSSPLAPRTIMCLEGKIPEGW